MASNGQVVFNIKKIKKRDFKRRTTIVEAPELNDAMGLEDGKTVIFHVQAGTLDDILRSKSLVDQETAALAMRMLSAMPEKDEKVRNVMDEFESLSGLSDKTKFELELVDRCVIDPKLTMPDWRWISDHFPFLITKLSSAIMELTIQGSMRSGDTK